MHLVSFKRDAETPVEAGIVLAETVVPIREALRVAREKVDLLAPAKLRGLEHVPMDALLARWEATQSALHGAIGRLERSAALRLEHGVPLADVELHAPVPQPPSIRDFYAFEEHVSRSWKRRGEPVPEAWYETPVFYFTNPAAVYGPGQAVPKPTSTDALDFELELAWVIGSPASNLDAEEAERVIAGLTIMNDWSARDVQREEMSVGLGPSKGKDFATSLGPALVTLDDLEEHRQGSSWDLTMTARVNGEEVSRGMLSDSHYSLAEMTAHASQDTRLVPGDVLATGTVGTGSILDLGSDDWLEVGDVVSLEIEGIGVLENRVVAPN